MMVWGGGDGMGRGDVWEVMVWGGDCVGRR